MKTHYENSRDLFSKIEEDLSWHERRLDGEPRWVRQFPTLWNGKGCSFQTGTDVGMARAAIEDYERMHGRGRSISACEERLSRAKGISPLDRTRISGNIRYHLATRHPEPPHSRQRPGQGVSAASAFSRVTFWIRRQ